MRLELKDIESSVVYTVDDGGAVLGRERARTDINFRDESISKRHARIFPEGGSWYVEDLGSSNGTYVRDQRISEPAVLVQGSSFTLAQRRFEVVFLEGNADVGGGTDVALAETGSVTPSDDAEAAPPFSVSALLIALPKALATFMASVPLMAVNPLGVIRKSSEEQRREPMSGGELAAHGLIANGVASLVGAIMGLLAGLIAGHFSFGALLAALPTAGIAAIVGAVLGFFFHPIIGWLVRLLGGSSTPRSRTNYAIDVYTFTILATVPQGLAVMIAMIPLPFVGVIPVLLNVLVSLLGLFLAYRWVVAFGLASWVRYVVMVFAALVAIGGAWNVVSTILSSASGLVSGSGSAETADTSVDTTELEGELSDFEAKARARAEAAEKAAREAMMGGQVEPEDATSVTEPAAPKTEPVAPKPTETKVTEAKVVETTRDPKPAVAPTPAAAPELPVVDPSTVDRDHPRGRTDYVVYSEKLEAIEKAISDDPSLLDRKDVLDDYKPLWRITYETRDKWQRLQRGKAKWERDKILDRKEAKEIYGRTKSYVDRLYRTLFAKE